MRSNLVRMAALLSLCIGGHLAYGAASGPPPERQGLFVDGIPAPVLGTNVEVRVTGIIARAKVTQIFTNRRRRGWRESTSFPCRRTRRSMR
jgi:hypothetical protein